MPQMKPSRGRNAVAWVEEEEGDGKGDGTCLPGWSLHCAFRGIAPVPWPFSIRTVGD